jgi:hypothetical protein
MLQHPETEEAIESSRSKRHRKHVSLNDQDIAPRAVRGIVRIDRVAEIERYDGRARACRLLRKSTRTAANLENHLAALVPGPIRLAQKPLFGDR